MKERVRTSRQIPKTSREIARMRLRQTLASDFIECSAEQFETMQQEILEILSRYIKIDEIPEIQLNLIQKFRQGVPYVKTIQIKGL